MNDEKEDILNFNRKINIAVKFKREGNYKEALECYEEISREYPNDPVVYFSWAKTLVSDGNFEKAINYFQLAKNLFAQEDNDNGEFQCQTHIDNLNELDKNSPEFLNYMKNISGNKDYKLFVDYCDVKSMYPSKNLESIEKDMDDIKRRIANHAGLLLAGEPLYEIIKSLEKEMDLIYTHYNNDIVINNNPLSETIFLLSKMYFEKGYEEEANKLKNKAIDLDPNNNDYC